MTDETPADCWTVTTQEELDEVLAERAKNASVCIHVHGAAEETVLAWQQANHVEPKINGQWT